MTSETENPDRPEKRQRRTIYLVPNFFTTAALFAGFYGIVAATQGRFETAAVAIFIAMIMDGIDGRVARITKTESDFGAQYDSIADMVSFGLAPALVMYEWSLSKMGMLGWYWSKLGWLAAFIYVAAAALRLARFNTQVAIADKKIFQGLASPSAAALLVGLVWLGDDLGYKGNQLMYLSFVVTLIAGSLMVSTISYYSFKDIGTKNKIPFAALFIVVMIFVFASIDPPKVVFGFFALYALSGPAMSIIRKIRKRSL